MKELKQLENHLRSWTPRRPSASIKQRLFPQSAAVEMELPDAIHWRWLVPAMALCIGALIVLARSAGSGFGDSSFRLAPTLPSVISISRLITRPRFKTTAISCPWQNLNGQMALILQQHHLRFLIEPDTENELN